MTVKGVKGGSRVRHIHGEDLKKLEDQLETLPYKTDIIGINKVGGQWYIHFYIPELTFDKPEVKKEIVKKTKTRRQK